MANLRDMPDKMAAMFKLDNWVPKSIDQVEFFNRLYNVQEIV
jgi:hypothetical protein